MFMYINEVMCSSARPTIAKPRPFPDFYPDSAAVFTQTLHRSPSEYFIEILCYTTCVFLVVFFITLLNLPYLLSVKLPYLLIFLIKLTLIKLTSLRPLFALLNTAEISLSSITSDNRVTSSVENQQQYTGYETLWKC